MYFVCMYCSGSVCGSCCGMFWLLRGGRYSCFLLDCSVSGHIIKLVKEEKAECLFAENLPPVDSYFPSVHKDRQVLFSCRKTTGPTPNPL